MRGSQWRSAWRDGDPARSRHAAVDSAALAALQAAADELVDSRAFVERMDVAIVASDPQGRLLLCNRLARELYAAQDTPGEPVEEWARAVEVSESDGVTATAERLPLGRALREGAVRDVELHIAAPDAPPRRVMAHARRVRAADDTLLGAVAVLYDVTALRDETSRLRAACRDLEETNDVLTRSVVDLEAFAGAVSHDLKSPLATVSGYVQLLTHLDADGRLSLEYDEFCARIAESVQSMRTLIDDILAFATAAGSSIEPLPVDLDWVVRDVVAGHIEMIGVGASAAPMPEISVAELPPVFGDQAMLRRVVDNIISNAIKYTHPGQAAQIGVNAVDDAPGWVRLEFADRGVGIPEGRHDTIFAGFQRAHREAGYPGHGLGLAFCRRIIERHGGRIGAVPNPGGGTRFWLTLPSSAEAVRAVSSRADDGSAATEAPVADRGPGDAAAPGQGPGTAAVTRQARQHFFGASISAQ